MIIPFKLEIADHSFSSNQKLSGGLKYKLGKLLNSKNNVRPYPNHCTHQWTDKTLVELLFRFIQHICRWLEFLFEVHGCRILDRLSVLHSQTLFFRQQYSILTLCNLNTKAPGQITKIYDLVVYHEILLDQFQTLVSTWITMTSSTCIAIIANETFPLTSCSTRTKRHGSDLHRVNLSRYRVWSTALFHERRAFFGP